MGHFCLPKGVLRVLIGPFCSQYGEKKAAEKNTLQAMEDGRTAAMEDGDKLQRKELYYKIFANILYLNRLFISLRPKWMKGGGAIKLLFFVLNG